MAVQVQEKEALISAMAALRAKLIALRLEADSTQIAAYDYETFNARQMKFQVAELELRALTLELDVMLAEERAEKVVPLAPAV